MNLKPLIESREPLPFRDAMGHAMEMAHRIHFLKIVPERNLPRAFSTLSGVANFDNGWDTSEWKEAVGSTLVSHMDHLSSTFTCSSVIWNVQVSTTKREIVEKGGRDWFDMWRHYAMCSLTLDVIVIEIKREQNALMHAYSQRKMDEFRAGIGPNDKGALTWERFQSLVSARRVTRPRISGALPQFE